MGTQGFIFALLLFLSEVACVHFPNLDRGPMVFPSNEPQQSSQQAEPELSLEQEQPQQPPEPAQPPPPAEGHQLQEERAFPQDQTLAEEVQQLQDNRRLLDEQEKLDHQAGPNGHPRFATRGFWGGLKKVGGAIARGVKRVGGALWRGAKAVGGTLLNGLYNLQYQLPPYPSGGPNPPNYFHFRKQDIEDCIACQYVWYQVEQEIGNDQIEENIYDAFAQTCIDAQKAPIFYPACEHMFDDIYGMIGDYLDGRLNVNQLCIGAGFCRDPNPPIKKPKPPPPPPPPPPAPVPVIPPPGMFNPIMLSPIVTPPPPPPPDPRPQKLHQLQSSFLVELHFKNGYNLYRLFDYPQKNKKRTWANAGGFGEEYQNFPRAWKRFESKLKALYRTEYRNVRLVLFVAGKASVVGQPAPNKVLAENRAKAGACYLDAYLRHRGFKNYVFRIGHIPQEPVDQGKDPVTQARDRKVLIFFEANSRFFGLFTSLLGGREKALTWSAGSANMAAYCNDRRLWQNEMFDPEWIKI